MRRTTRRGWVIATVAAVIGTGILINTGGEPQLDYYVSSSTGSDSYPGTSPDSAFASISKLNTITLSPGDSVGLKKGDTFAGILNATTNNVVYMSYGSGTSPKIDQFIIDTSTVENVEYSGLDIFTVLNNDNEQLLIHSDFSGTTFIEQSEDVDSLNFFYVKGASSWLTKSNWATQKVSPISSWRLMNGKDTLNENNSPEIVTDPVNPFVKMLKVKSQGGNEYITARPSSPNDWATRTQFDIATTSGVGLDSLYYEVDMYLPDAWEVLQDLNSTITWMTIGEFWNESTYPNMLRITLTLAKLSAGSPDLNFRMTCETKESSEDDFVEQWEFNGTNFDIPIEQKFKLKVNILEANGTSGKVYLAAEVNGTTTEIINETGVMTKHPNQTADGFEYFAPIKMYTYDKYADSCRVHGKELAIYYGNFRLLNGRSVWSAPTEPDYLYGNFMQESFENTGSPGYDESSWVEVIGANTGNAVDENNTGTPPTGGGSQILRTSSNTTPTADATNSRAYTTFNSTGSINAKQTMYVDGWVYIEAHGLSTLTAAACVHLLDSTAAANPCIQLNVYNEAGTLKWYVSTYTNGATSNYTSSVTLTTGTWYHIKLKYDIANMTYGAWIGSTELISGSLTGSVRVNIDRIRLGVNATRELDVRYDLFNADTGTFSDY